MMQELDGDGCCTRCGALTTTVLASNCDDELIFKRMPDDPARPWYKYELRMVDGNDNSICIVFDDKEVEDLMADLAKAYQRFKVQGALAGDT